MYVSLRAIVQKAEIMFQQHIFNYFAAGIKLAAAPECAVSVKITKYNEWGRQLADEIVHIARSDGRTWWKIYRTYSDCVMT
jgi:hypothetical protein